MIKNLVLKTRTYRRFQQNERVQLETLKTLVDIGRLGASAKNAQPLKYIIVNDPEKNDLVYSNTKWAGYITDWDGPEEGERPPAYIVVLWDKKANDTKDLVLVDLGIASQNIVLGAMDEGIGACMIWAFNRKKITDILEIEEGYEPLLVIALGKPKEEVVIDEIEKEGDIKYWRDEERVHHVPKRKLEDVIYKYYTTK